MGKGGVSKAVDNVKSKIAPALVGKEICVRPCGAMMVGTTNLKKRELANIRLISGVSMACCRAGAAQKGISLYRPRHINELAGKPPMCMPVPCFNVINGGVHAGNYLAFQELGMEFFLIPVGASTFAEAMKLGSETYHNLKAIIKKKYGFWIAQQRSEAQPFVKATDGRTGIHNWNSSTSILASARFVWMAFEIDCGWNIYVDSSISRWPSLLVNCQTPSLLPRWGGFMVERLIKKMFKPLKVAQGLTSIQRRGNRGMTEPYCDAARSW
eukprot:Skav205934  [mRNA]  locus=scaffold2739:113674:120305:- [translate_table: standard]